MLQRISRWGVIALLAGVVFTTPAVVAQEQPAPAAKPRLDRLSGSVHMIDKKSSTIDVRRGTVHRKIVYTPQTRWTASNKPGSMTDMQEGSRIVAVGRFDDKARLVATRIEVARR
jgi:hypothetical protein